jgi:hypothetical protein
MTKILEINAEHSSISLNQRFPIVQKNYFCKTLKQTGTGFEIIQIQ